MRCCRCGRFLGPSRVWRFSNRLRLLDAARHVYGPGFDPFHWRCQAADPR